MLRNLNRASGSGRRLCGSVYNGRLASELPTGFPYPGLLASAVLPGDPPDARYSIEMLSYPASPAELSVDALGRWILNCPDGSYVLGRRVRMNGVARADDTVTFNVGVEPVPGPVDVDLVISYNVRAQVSADLVLSYNVRQQVHKDLVLSYNVNSEGPTMSFIPSAARTVTISPGAKPFIAGEFWNMSVPHKPRALKDPDSTIDISFDWGPWLADVGGDTIGTHTILMNEGLVDEGSAVIGTVVTVFHSGGTPAKRAEITCRIATNSTPPRIEDRTIFLDIESR